MRQVVTELDTLRAMYDYIAEQLDGRFRLQFPEFEWKIDELVEELRNPTYRVEAPSMKFSLAGLVSVIGSAVTECTLQGCPDDDQHKFMREVINLIWDARFNTAEWLKEKGIVPGQSAN